MYFSLWLNYSTRVFLVDKETEVEVGERERERDQPGGCGGRMSDSARLGEREKVL